MTMENNELNNKILKNVRNKIVVSNLEKEEAMKIENRKRFISLCATVIIFLSGSLLTVNAATDGKLAEDIKEKYKEITLFNYDESKYKLVDKKEEKLPSGENTVMYELISNDGLEEVKAVIFTDNLSEEDLKVTQQDSENDVFSIDIKSE